MNLIYYVSLIILFFSSGFIAYQDFKERQVSLCLIIVFGVINIFSVLYFRDLITLLYNFIGTSIYLVIIWVFLKGYLYLKFKKNKTIINESIGLADIYIIFFIGITFNFIGLIFFFCFSFILSLLFFLVSSSLKKDESHATVPLAGFLVLFYIITLIILNLIKNNFVVDCSYLL